MSGQGGKAAWALAWRVAVAVVAFGVGAAIVLAFGFPGAAKADRGAWAIGLGSTLTAVAVAAIKWQRRGDEGEESEAASGRQHVRSARGSRTLMAGGNVDTTGGSGTAGSLQSAKANKTAGRIDQRVRTGRRSTTIVAGGNIVTGPDEKK